VNIENAGKGAGPFLIVQQRGLKKLIKQSADAEINSSGQVTEVDE
jgi:hypothetical protein